MATIKLNCQSETTRQSRPSRNEGWQLDVDGVEVKACPAGVGGAASPFGAVVWSTMAPGVGFARLTNGSPAAAAANQRESSVGDEQQLRDAGGASPWNSQSITLEDCEEKLTCLCCDKPAASLWQCVDWATKKKKKQRQKKKTHNAHTSNRQNKLWAVFCLSHLVSRTKWKLGQNGNTCLRWVKLKWDFAVVLF